MVLHIIFIEMSNTDHNSFLDLVVVELLFTSIVTMMISFAFMCVFLFPVKTEFEHFYSHGALRMAALALWLFWGGAVLALTSLIPQD
ncbi:hypothetical protein F5880DRAFT_1578759 [Lentinula raphanica]|nr:hypothetical protein F5880DRAFT_1578759 [Lentinula raphanica]